MAWKREEASAVVVVWDITGTGDCGGTGEVVWRVGDGRDDGCKPWAVLRKVQYSASWPGLVHQQNRSKIASAYKCLRVLAIAASHTIKTRIASARSFLSIDSIEVWITIFSLNCNCLCEL